jgi:tannase/feruloyl esterase
MKRYLKLMIFLFLHTILPRADAQDRSAAATCESLAALALPDTTITLAQPVQAGAFTLPAEYGPHDFKGVPAFCRVTAEIKPAKDSDIRIEVWMPASSWNGGYRGIGNSVLAGYIAYDHLADLVRQGYAAASTDTGHQASPFDGAWALGHPEKVIDWGHRAIHEMTLKAKGIIRALYGKDPLHSYFEGGSGGGRQGLMEAQRYPEDYDGIIAGCPPISFTHLLVGGVWVSQATHDPASYIPPSKIPAISAAVLNACDAQDGVRDGILADPRQCHFDPGTMLCKNADSGSCLTASQVAALKKIYAGPRNSKGESIFPGYMPGGEEEQDGWANTLIGPAPDKAVASVLSNTFFSNMVFEDPAWNFKTFDFDSGVKFTDEKLARSLNASDPNLKPFMRRGGKLIVYHGWNDATIPAMSTVNYYNSVVAAMGIRDTSSFLRLYLAPGMQHCANGPGPDAFGQSGSSDAPQDPQRNLYLALRQWVENGTAPGTIVATKYEGGEPAKSVKMTRPLCPYPQAAKYNGTGNPNDAASFACTDEKR